MKTLVQCYADYIAAFAALCTYPDRLVEVDLNDFGIVLEAYPAPNEGEAPRPLRILSRPLARQ
jgi:hypothetical protein